MDEEEQPEDLNMFAAQFNSVAVKSVPPVAKYPTCAPIMTQVKIGGRKIAFECDTAASHNILSQETYQDIWRRGSGPKLKYHSVRVLLADGTRSSEQTRSMEVTVGTSNGK